MGIIFMFVAIVLLAYAFLATRLLYFVLHLLLVRWLQLAIAPHWLWSLICLILLPIALRMFYLFLLDSKGGTPDISFIWKFFMGLSVVLFGLSWWVGLRSK